MQEIWIPEALIVFFLSLPLVKPFFKKLDDLSGLTWLPLAAFLISLILIPAYGFRPEVIPLIIYASFMTGAGIFRAIRGEPKFRDYREKSLFMLVLPLIFLAAVGGIAFFFTPQKETALSASGVYTVNAGTVAGSDSGYTIRVYTHETSHDEPSVAVNAGRPLILLLPPSFRSQTSADMVCTELRNRGFTVISITRRIYSKGAIALISTYLSGAESGGANKRGRGYEEERKDDLLFLLSWVRQNPGISERERLFDLANQDAVFLAAYDAGGSALILLSEQLTQTGRNAPSNTRRLTGSYGSVSQTTLSQGSGVRIRGLIAIESPLWSLYRVEAPAHNDPPEDEGGFRGWFNSFRHGLGRWYEEARPKKVIGLEGIPELNNPALFLVSSRARTQIEKNGRFLTMYRSFESARASSFLITADGTSYLDFTDYPAKYPIVNVFFSGPGKRAWKNTDGPGVTALLITNFAAGLLERDEALTLKNGPWPAGINVQKK